MPGMASGSLVLRERGTAWCGISSVPNNAVIPSAVYASRWREGRSVLKDIAPGYTRPGTTNDVYADSRVIGDSGAGNVQQAARGRLVCLKTGRICTDHAVIDRTYRAVNLIDAYTAFGDLYIVNRQPH